MAAMNFPPLFITWVKNCVATSRFSLNLNGSLVGYFASERGLRQGDLLSPTLFLLVMEAFSQLLNINVVQMGYDYHPRCTKLQLTHITFADDLFFISIATMRSVQTIKTKL